MDEERDNELTFLGALVEQRSFAFVTSIYRKPTFTGSYLSWDAFAPMSRKVNLIKCLTFRALNMCSDKIKSEFEQIENIFLGNRCPEEVIVDTFKTTVNKFRNNIRPFVYFMWDFPGLDLLVSWLPIRFLPLLHAVIMWLWFEPFL